MFCVYTEVMAQNDTVTFDKTTPHCQLIVSFYLCVRLTSPNYAFMRCRLYSNQNVIQYMPFHGLMNLIPRSQNHTLNSRHDLVYVHVIQFRTFLVSLSYKLIFSAMMRLVLCSRQINLYFMYVPFIDNYQIKTTEKKCTISKIVCLHVYCEIQK